MSKIAITPNASGTGTFTIAAPNSNTDRTLTLPDAAGAVVIDEAGGGSVKIDSSGNMGIGITPAVNTPTKLTVAGDVTMSGNSRSILGNLYFASSGWKYAANGNAWGIIEGNGNLQFYNAPENSSGAGAAAAIVQRMRIDSAGRVTTPYQPAFFAYWNNPSFRFGIAETLWDTTRFNIGNHYNSGTGRFTAPVSGVYQFNLQMQHDGAVATSGYIDIRLNGGSINARYEHFGGATYEAAGISVTIYMNANDWVDAYGSGAVWWSHHSSFSGFLVG